MSIIRKSLKQLIEKDRGAAYVDNQYTVRQAKSVPCADCKRKFPPVCMDFDHRENEVKLFNISSSCHRAKNFILAEIAKCDVVCACCHRIRTERRGFSGERPKLPQL